MNVVYKFVPEYETAEEKLKKTLFRMLVSFLKLSVLVL